MVKIYYIHGEPDYYFYGLNFITFMVDSYYIYGEFYIYGWLLLHLWLVLHLWFSKATVYTNSSVVRRILFFSKFKYGYYNAFSPISGENTTFKDEIKEFTNWSF